MCTDPESFVRGVPSLTLLVNEGRREDLKHIKEGQQVFFLVDEGTEDPITNKSGPSSAYQRKTI